MRNDFMLLGLVALVLTAASFLGSSITGYAAMGGSSVLVHNAGFFVTAILAFIFLTGGFLWISAMRAKRK